MHKTEGLVNYQVAYMKPIKLCKTSWMSYLQVCCINGYVKNVCLYLITSWDTTPKMCITQLQEMPGISMSHQETNAYETNTCSTICFHIY